MFQQMTYNFSLEYFIELVYMSSVPKQVFDNVQINNLTLPINGLFSSLGSLTFAVTQQTSVTTSVTLNSRAGVITMFGVCGPGGTNFHLLNSYIKSTSLVMAFSQNTLCQTSGKPIFITIGAVIDGDAHIFASGDGVNPSTVAPIINFIVFN